MGQMVDPVIPCQGITNKNLLHLGLSGKFFRPEETHPAGGGGGKGRRRSEADGSDSTGELHGGKVCAAVSRSGVRHRRSGVGWAQSKAEEHVIV